jgi:hypothetical protein
MLEIARLESVDALGSELCEREEIPWMEYSTVLRAAEVSDIATRKKNPKSTV